MLCANQFRQPVFQPYLAVRMQIRNVYDAQRRPQLCGVERYVGYLWPVRLNRVSIGYTEDADCGCHVNTGFQPAPEALRLAAAPAGKCEDRRSKVNAEDDSHKHRDAQVLKKPDRMEDR